MSRLSDSQLVLLSTAAQRDNGSVLPPAHSLPDHAGRLTRTIRALLKQELVSEAEVTDPKRAWRDEDERRIGVFITAAGREAIGAEPISSAAAALPVELTTSTTPPEKKPSKTGLVLGLLARQQGATLDELVQATGWLPHTTRAALTGLRKKGHVLAKSKRANATCYTLQAA